MGRGLRWFLVLGGQVQYLELYPESKGGVLKV